MESDNVQHENEPPEETTNESEDIPLNQKHLETTGMYGLLQNIYLALV